MNRKELLIIRKEIADFKIKKGINIIDTHTHPSDVMGVLPYGHSSESGDAKDYLIPGILERVNFGIIEKIASGPFFSLFPNTVNNIIRKDYGVIDQARILSEMDVALIDRAVMLPIEPWLSAETVGNAFSSNRFIKLGSVDVHGVASERIDSILSNLLAKYNIKGIKLHPNLQDFKPQPSHNKSDIADKLHRIYKFAENHGLYLLFHGGISHFTNRVDESYGDVSRSKNNAVLKNFCDSDGKSELLQSYKMPIVIAHLGHYGMAFPDYHLIKTMIRKFDNLYFDTACASPKVIGRILDIVPSSKILFGSDALYYRMAYKLAFVYLAVKNSYNGEDKEDMLCNILQNNFLKITNSI